MPLLYSKEPIVLQLRQRKIIIKKKTSCCSFSVIILNTWECRFNLYRLWPLDFSFICQNYIRPSSAIFCYPVVYRSKINYRPDLQLWVFGHDLQNQSYASANSTKLALAIPLAFVPVQHHHSTNPSQYLDFNSVFFFLLESQLMKVPGWLNPHQVSHSSNGLGMIQVLSLICS